MIYKIFQYTFFIIHNQFNWLFKTMPLVRILNNTNHSEKANYIISRSSPYIIVSTDREEAFIKY